MWWNSNKTKQPSNYPSINEDNNTYEYRQKLIRSYYVVVLNHVEKKLDEWIGETCPSIHNGDIVTFDYLNINGGHNSWDGGVKTVLRNKIINQFDLTVTKVIVDKSYYTEIIQQFLDNINVEKYVDRTSDTLLINDFELFIGSFNPKTRHGLQLDNKYGFFYVVHYETDVDIPKYPLNIKCFLKKGTQEYDFTVEYWEQLYYMDSLIQDLNVQRKKINEEMNQKFIEIRTWLSTKN